MLGLQRKPSYWDLPVELQSLLLERQLAVSNEFLGLRVKFTSETGSRGVRSAVGAVRAARLVPVSAARHTADRPSLGVLGYGQQPPCAPVAPSRLASRGAQSASVRCAFEPELLKADNTLWKPMEVRGASHPIHHTTTPPPLTNRAAEQTEEAR